MIMWLDVIKGMLKDYNSDCSSHSIDKLSSNHSSALDWTWARQWALLSSCSLSHLGKPALKTSWICSCRRCWQSVAVSRQNFGTFVFCCLSTSGQAKHCHLVDGKEVKQVMQILARLLPGTHHQVRMLPNLSNLRTRGPVCPSSTLWYLVSRSASGLLYSSGIRLALFSSPPAFCSLP